MSQISNVPTMISTFDKEKYEKLKAEYKKAVESNLDTFEFDGTILLISYAKYLLEYLKSKLT